MAAPPWWTQWIFICILVATKGATAKQRCYVCIPNTGLSIQDVVALFPSGPTIPLCNQFQPGIRVFIRDCPDNEEYVGCITETNGTHVTKTCTTTAVKDCETANDIRYCYCMGDLCNAELVPEEEARPPVAIPHSLYPPHDDEDDELSESSGDSSESSQLPTHIYPETISDPSRTTEKQIIVNNNNNAATVTATFIGLFIGILLNKLV